MGRVPAATNYAARALVELAVSPEQVLPLPVIAERQQISLRFLEHIFRDLRAAGLVRSQRGGHGQGGYRLTLPPAELTLAAVVAATRPSSEALPLPGSGEPRPSSVAALDAVWLALEAKTRQFLSGVTIADLAAGRLPTAP